MVNAMVFDQEKRLRSYEIVAELFSDNEKKLTADGRG